MTHTNTEGLSDDTVLEVAMAIDAEAFREDYPVLGALHYKTRQNIARKKAVGVIAALSRRAANSAGGVEGLQRYFDDPSKWPGEKHPSLAAEAEPVAWVTADILAAMERGERAVPGWKRSDDFCIPLYTHPSSPVSAEVTVTDEMMFAAMKRADELDVIFDDIDGREILAAALAAINGGRENG